MEVLSDTAHARDLGEKRRWYRDIGVREYVVADLLGKYAGERRRQRWRLENEDPESTTPPDVALEGETIVSAVLPLGLLVRDGWVRLIDRQSGKELPLLREQLAQGRLEAQAREEWERRLAAEARRLEAEARQREAEIRAAAEAAARRGRGACPLAAGTAAPPERDQPL